MPSIYNSHQIFIIATTPNTAPKRKIPARPRRITTCSSASPLPAASPAARIRHRRVNDGTCRAMGLGLRLPFFLLVLLLVSLGVAQGRGTVFLDIKEDARGPGQIIKDELTLSKIPVHVERSSPLCPACEKFTEEALSYLTQKQSQDKMMEVLHEACSRTLSLEHQCVEFVDSYATLFFTKIAEIKPEEFCKQNGLCRDNALLSAVKSESTCVFCHHLMDEVMSKLKDPDSEFEILQILLKECKKIEGHEQQCKRLVLQYIPLILVNGEKFLEKNDVCTIVQACDAGKKTMVGSFSEEGLLSDA